MEKKSYITLLSVISMIAVVFLHTNTCFWNFSYDSYWASANIIESIFYFAVPIFYMITGVTLIDYKDRYSDKEYLKKRVQKTLIPFLIWSLIGLIYMILVHNVKYGFKDIINGIINTEIVNIYWFFIPLFIIYMSIPLYSYIKKQDRKKLFSYLAILGFILNSLIPFLKNVLGINSLWPLTLTVINGYLIYPIIGYLLDRYELSKKLKITIYILAIVGLLMHIIGTYYLSIKEGEIIQIFKGYTNVPAILYATGIFIFFKDYGNKIMKKISKIINFLSKYTFSTYLIHFFIMDILTILLKKINILNTSLLYRLLGPFIVIPIAILITIILRKIKVVKNIVP